MEFLVEGLRAVTWQQVVMYLVGFVLIYLAIRKEYEPSLLLPMGFGAILVTYPSQVCWIRRCRVVSSRMELFNGCSIRESRPRKRCRSCCLSASEP